MKTWFIYLFAFLHISTTTPLYELYKLPVFVTHFIEHDKGGNLIDEMEVFLVHHYGGHEMDEDWETDQKLPFIHVDFVHIDFIFNAIKTFITEHLNKYIPSKSIIFYNEDTLYSHYLNSIWQPPKFS